MELNLSESQWQEISEIKTYWINNVSEKISDDQLILAATKLYKIAGKKIPEFKIVDSPLSAIVSFVTQPSNRKFMTKDYHLACSLGYFLGAILGSPLDNESFKIEKSRYYRERTFFWDLVGSPLGDALDTSFNESILNQALLSLYIVNDYLVHKGLGIRFFQDVLGYFSINKSLAFYWHKSHVAFITSAKILGATYDLQKYEDYELICRNLSWIIPCKDICIISRNPIFVGWDDNGRVHAENRAAVEYADGFQIWAINGVIVPKSVVMEPEKQTLKDIQNESNEEVRRIRIERFTWDRYLIESKAKVLDFWESPNRNLESLMQCKEYTVLCINDPSTGRPYSLEVDSTCQTCEEAQLYLLAPEIALSGLGITCKSNYPLIRT